MNRLSFEWAFTDFCTVLTADHLEAQMINGVIVFRTKEMPKPARDEAAGVLRIHRHVYVCPLDGCITREGVRAQFNR